MVPWFGSGPISNMAGQAHSGLFGLLPFVTTILVATQKFGFCSGNPLRR